MHQKRRSQFPRIVEAREATKKIAALSKKHRAGLVFGREKTGLTNAESRQCHDLASVSRAAEHPSFNLTQVAMSFSYETYLASLGQVPKARYNLATVHEVESVLKHLSESLTKVGFRLHQSDPESFLRSLRRVLSRAPLEKRDVDLLHRNCQRIDYYVKVHPSEKHPA
jgi:TrmH family RNA methyltransferase